MGKFILAIVAVLAFVSCSTKKDLAYFEDLGTSVSGQLGLSDYSIKLEPEDELMITVSSEIPEATAQYNMPLSNPVTERNIASATLSLTQEDAPSSINSQRQPTYVVNAEGYIDFPVLGMIHVEGMTTEELTDYLKKRIERDVKNPMVMVRLVNFKVNVLGEVQSPQIVRVPGQRFSIFDALAACGDMTEYGRRDNVIVIRENNDGTLSYNRLNLRSSSITSSPFYYLKQNDVVYVEPNEIRQANSKYNQNNGFKLSVISTIVSATSVIASLIIALTVK